MIIDLEGIDGAGKATQCQMLADRIRDLRGTESVATFNFPDYTGTFFGAQIRKYLDGEIETPDPRLTALLFAGDRLETLPKIKAAMAANKIVIFDRYVPSNLAYQGARLPEDREAFRIWLEAVEYEAYKLPRPDRVLFLDVEVDSGPRNVNVRDGKGDIYEANWKFLAEVVDEFRDMARKNSNWHTIQCMDGERLRSIERIHEDIWAVVSFEVGLQGRFSEDCTETE